MTDLRDDPGSRLASQCIRDIRRVSDQRLLAATFQKQDGCLHLGQHAAFRKVPLFDVLLRLCDCHPIQVLLIRFVEIDGNFFYRRRDQQ